MSGTTWKYCKILTTAHDLVVYYISLVSRESFQCYVCFATCWKAQHPVLSVLQRTTAIHVSYVTWSVRVAHLWREIRNQPLHIVLETRLWHLKVTDVWNMSYLRSEVVSFGNLASSVSSVAASSVSTLRTIPSGVVTSFSSGISFMQPTTTRNTKPSYTFRFK